MSKLSYIAGGDFDGPRAGPAVVDKVLEYEQRRVGGPLDVARSHGVVPIPQVPPPPGLPSGGVQDLERVVRLLPGGLQGVVA